MDILCLGSPEIVSPSTLAFSAAAREHGRSCARAPVIKRDTVAMPRAAPPRYAISSRAAEVYADASWRVMSTCVATTDFTASF